MSLTASPLAFENKPGQDAPAEKSVQWKLIVLCAFAFFALISLAELGVNLLHRSQVAENRSHAVDFAAQLKSRLETELNHIIYLSSGLSSYFVVNAKKLDRHEVEQMLAGLFQNARHIKNLGVAVGYVLEFVHPLEGNEAVLGLDYRSLPKQLRGVQATIDSRRPQLTPRLQLVQGGNGVIYRAPIFVDGSYWGLLSTVIDIDALLHTALYEGSDHGFPFAVIDFPTDGQTLWGDSDVAALSNVASVSTTMGWRVKVKPITARSQVNLRFILRGLGYFVALVSAFTLYTILLHRQQLLHLSQHDPLTGIANRRAFDERVAIAVARIERNPSQGFAIAVIDLDGFKLINDSFGHAAGDAVLIEVSRRLLALLRETDLVARWGGDEFGIYLDSPKERDANLLRERLSTIFLRPINFRRNELHIGGSVGLVMAPQDGSTAAQLFSAADHAMYLQKAKMQQQKDQRV